MGDSSLCFLSTFGGCINLDELRFAPEFATLELEAGTKGFWDQSLLKHKNGAEIARVERYDADPFQLGAKKIGDCVEEVRDKTPVRAANWLADFLQRVKTFYVFHPLPGARKGEAWRELDAVADYLWHEHGGIFRTPEGFTNQWGYHILYSAPDAVRGPRWTALLQPDGNWVHFKMDLGDRMHLERLFRGELPEGVELARLGQDDPFELYNPFESAY